MKARKWYELGTIRLWSETYDVYKVFNTYFIRLHYRQYRFSTGKEISRRLIEVEPGSQIAWIIQRTVDGQPENVIEVLGMLQIAGAS